MNLIEGEVTDEKQDVKNIFAEEAEKSGSAGTSAQINKDDFTVTSFDIPADKKTEPAAAPAAEQTKKTETVTDDSGKTTVKETVIVKEPATSEQAKGSAFTRAFNTNTVVLFGDILLRRFGGIITPERKNNREYWGLSIEDKADLSTLLKASAEEGSWTGIPTKWLLLTVLFIIIGGKIIYAKKLQYDVVPGSEGAGSGGSAANTSSAATAEKKEELSTDKDYQAMFIREKARWTAEQELKINNEEVSELKKQNEYLRKMVEMAALKNGQRGSGISDAEILSETKFEMKMENEPAQHIFTDSSGKKWNLADIEFTERGAILDKTKAGLPGYSIYGIKTGNVPKTQYEAFEAWKKFKKKHKEVPA